MEQFLAPAWLDPSSRIEALKSVHRVDGSLRNRFDFLLCDAGIPLTSNAWHFNPVDTESTARAIVADHQTLELAMARRFPLFRRPVADKIIHRISRENALFSLVTALPNVIPSVIDLPWAIGEFATDTAFLTMNQIRMALLMAAAHGHVIGYTEQKAQIAVIVAGGFRLARAGAGTGRENSIGRGTHPQSRGCVRRHLCSWIGPRKAQPDRLRPVAPREKGRPTRTPFAKGREVVQ